MIKTKVKAFLKYKEYRTHIKDKFFKKYKFKSFILLVILLFVTFNLFNVNFFKSTNFRYSYANNIFDLKQFVTLNKILENDKNEDLVQVKNENSQKPINEISASIDKTKSSLNEQQIPINQKQFNDEINIQNQYDDILKKYQDLQAENEMLKDDNISLQNSLKLAAANGMKPRNYRDAQPVISRSGLLRGEYAGKFEVTSYTPSKDECGNDKGITASGHPIVAGVSVAVDTKYWPLGTIFYIKGLGYVVAMDTGNAVKGKHRIDYAVFDKQFAKKIGRRNYDVYLIKIGTGKVENYVF